MTIFAWVFGSWWVVTGLLAVVLGAIVDWPPRHQDRWVPPAALIIMAAPWIIGVLMLGGPISVLIVVHHLKKKREEYALRQPPIARTQHGE